MRANLKEMYSLELSTTLEEYRPAIPENFGLSVRLMVGPEGGNSMESFDVLVCTPDWIKEQFSQERCIWGRHMLIVLEYDYALILQKISKHVASCQGKDWEEVANSVARVAAWEFEDYQPYSQ
jgi:hypothetical protein